MNEILETEKARRNAAFKNEGRSVSERGRRKRRHDRKDSCKKKIEWRTGKRRGNILHSNRTEKRVCSGTGRSKNILRELKLLIYTLFDYNIR